MFPPRMMIKFFTSLDLSQTISKNSVSLVKLIYSYFFLLKLDKHKYPFVWYVCFLDILHHLIITKKKSILFSMRTPDDSFLSEVIKAFDIRDTLNILVLVYLSLILIFD